MLTFLICFQRQGWLPMNEMFDWRQVCRDFRKWLLDAEWKLCDRYYLLNSFKVDPFAEYHSNSCLPEIEKGDFPSVTLHSIHTDIRTFLICIWFSVYNQSKIKTQHSLTIVLVYFINKSSYLIVVDFWQSHYYDW